MSHLLLIRHGETDWNVEGRWQGQADVALNSRGLLQAEQIANSLCSVKIQAIYSSDLQRALQTAEALARKKELIVQIDPRLREIHQGEWQGLKIEEIETRYAQAFQERKQNPLYVAPPGGETALQVQDRVLEALREISLHHVQDTVAVVSHGFSIAVALAWFYGRSIDNVWELVPKNGAVIEIDTTIKL